MAGAGQFVGPLRLLGPVEHADLPRFGQGRADVEVDEARCHPWFLSGRGAVREPRYGWSVTRQSHEEDEFVSGC